MVLFKLNILLPTIIWDDDIFQRGLPVFSGSMP